MICFYAKKKIIKISLNYPDKLSPYLEACHGVFDVEQRAVTLIMMLLIILYNHV